MHLKLEPRAEIARRSLDKVDQKRVDRALSNLAAADPGAHIQNSNRLALSPASPKKRLFAYRAGPRLRLIFSLEGDVCVIEDIVDHDRLDRLFGRAEQ